MSTQENHETEVRAFLSKEEYERLLGFFANEGKRTYASQEKTLYLAGDEDLRLRRTDEGASIILKSGKLHDASRKETEVTFDRAQFDDVAKMFAKLGKPVEIAWDRVRETFSWNGVSAMLDDTRDYGYVIELETMTTEAEADAAHERLRGLLRELDVVETPKEAFAKAYEEYCDRNRQDGSASHEDDADLDLPGAQPGRTCICGHTKTPPWCDGTHSDIEAGDGPKVSLEEWLENDQEGDELADRL